MPIEPAIADLLAELADSLTETIDSSHPVESDPVARRAVMEQAHEALLDQMPAYPAFPDLRVESRSIDVDGRIIPVRVFTPKGPGPFPAFLYFFGGAWWQRTYDSRDIVDACASAAADGGVVVVEVDYRLAPEHPYPAALDDALEVLRWIAGSPEGVAVDPTRIAVGGQSSGGNLAAALCLRARDEGAPAIGLQILEVPALNLDRSRHPSTTDSRTASTTESATESATESDEEHGFAEALLYYLGEDPVAALDPYVSPVLAVDLSDLPEALILTAEFDILREEGLRYAARLLESGVPATAVMYAGKVHFTPSLRTLTPSGRAWRGQVAQALRTFGMEER